GVHKFRTQKGIGLRCTAVEQSFAASGALEGGPVEEHTGTVVDGEGTTDSPAGAVSGTQHCGLPDGDGRVGGAVDGRGIIEILFAGRQEQPVGVHVAAVCPPRQA
ncbi:MAG: hypothetical protein ACK56I_14900, partial [bacterium]